MPHSLWTRLMGVFLGVIVVGVVVMIISVRLSTADQLRRRVLSDDVAQANALAPLLSSFYSQQGNWNGVEAFLASAPTDIGNTSTGGMMGPGMMPWHDGKLAAMGSSRAHYRPTAERVVLLDASGKVIADTGRASTGEIHLPEHLKNGVPITLNRQSVGTILVGSMIEPVSTRRMKISELSELLYSYHFTRRRSAGFDLRLAPLSTNHLSSARLSQSAEAIAGGELGQRLKFARRMRLGASPSRSTEWLKV